MEEMTIKEIKADFNKILVETGDKYIKTFLDDLLLDQGIKIDYYSFSRWLNGYPNKKDDAQYRQLTLDYINKNKKQ